MKKIFLLSLSFLFITHILGQNQGISYQAVIIDKNAQEIPGADISGNIIPNHQILVRFTILDAAGAIIYQEEHSTTTDAYGMINLTIGKGNPTTASPFTFIELDWDGAPKDLKVDISLSQSDVFYTDFSYQELNFVPYAYHKNITATGILKVDGKSSLQDLAVDKTTNLNGSLTVNNASPTHLSGNLEVEQTTTLGKSLTVNSNSNLNGQVTIADNVSMDQTSTTSYPLYIKGSSQGISIKITGSKSSANNFVLFSDESGVQGRIEGESTEDVYTDPKYIFDNIGYVVELGLAIKDIVAASTSSTVCVGLGACVTTPTPSLIIAAIAKTVVKVVMIAQYNYFRFENAGVVFRTKGADYAEYLPKANLADKIYPGDIVGIKGGYVSLKTDDAEMVMVVSSLPIVVGNSPKSGHEEDYVRVAFIGQAPAKVLGSINPGDYILPSGSNDGVGMAVSPDNIEPYQYQKIVGIAWPNDGLAQYGYVNVAVGLNANDVSRMSIKQEKKIFRLETKVDSLENQINRMNAALVQLLPNYATLMQIDPNLTTKSISTTSNKHNVGSNKQQTSSESSKSDQTDQYTERTVIYGGVTEEQIYLGIDAAEQMLKEKGIDISNNQFFVKMKSKSNYKEEFVNDLMNTITKELDKSYEADVKSGAKVIKLY